jgi:hypothetical protein
MGTWCRAAHADRLDGVPGLDRVVLDDAFGRGRHGRGHGQRLELLWRLVVRRVLGADC